MKRRVSSEHQDMFLFLHVVMVIARRAARRRLLNAYAEVLATQIEEPPRCFASLRFAFLVDGGVDVGNTIVHSRLPWQVAGNRVSIQVSGAAERKLPGYVSGGRLQ